MTRGETRVLLLVCPVVVVALTVAIGYAGHTEPAKAGSRLASGDSKPSSMIEFAESRGASDCPTVHRDLFGEPVHPVHSKLPAKPVLPAPASASPVSQPPPNPLGEYGYTGLVGDGEGATALVEHAKSKEGHYLRAGDPFLGGAITAISASEVSLQIGSETYSLRRQDRYSLVPLDKDAPVGTSDQPSTVLSALDNVNSSLVLSYDPDTAMANWSTSAIVSDRLLYTNSVGFLLMNAGSSEEMNRRFEGR
jgi:hypothetical protein